MALQIPREPIITENGVTTPTPIEVPDQFATVRTNPIHGGIDYLGVVGSKYEPVQNEASCTLLDALTEEGEGSLRDSRGTARRPRHLRHDEASEIDGL